MTTTNDSRKFFDEVVNVNRDYILDDTVEWVCNNLEPEDIFDEDKLKQWAEENDYVLEED